jgi:hypothetical protein
MGSRCDAAGIARHFLSIVALEPGNIISTIEVEEQQKACFALACA